MYLLCAAACLGACMRVVKMLLDVRLGMLTSPAVMSRVMDVASCVDGRHEARAGHHEARDGRLGELGSILRGARGRSLFLNTRASTSTSTRIPRGSRRTNNSA